MRRSSLFYAVLLSAALCTLGTNCRAEILKDLIPIDCEKTETNPTPPAAKTPTASQPAMKELATCDAMTLYFGIGRKKDFDAARRCGYLQLGAASTEANIFHGAGILSMLYANGYGVTRDLPRAAAFVCAHQWLMPHEKTRALASLSALASKEASAPPSDSFDLCEFANTTISIQSCALRASMLAGERREQALRKLQSDWPSEWKKAYAKVEAAERKYQEARGGELDASGTVRGIAFLAEQDRLRDQQMINLREFLAGKSPRVTQRKWQADDAELQTLYQRLIALPANDRLGTVTPEGVERTQAAWVYARDEWVRFIRVAKPETSPTQIKSRLTRQRLHQLQRVEPWLRMGE